MDIFVKVFVPIIVAVISAVGGFFGGRAYQVKVVQKRKEKKMNTVDGNNNLVGDGNESVKGNKTVITDDKSKTEDKSVNVVAKGKNSVAAGRDIKYGSDKK